MDSLPQVTIFGGTVFVPWGGRLPTVYQLPGIQPSPAVSPSLPGASRIIVVIR